MDLCEEVGDGLGKVLGDRGRLAHHNLFNRDRVFEAHRLLYHSTLGLRVMKKKKRVATLRTMWAIFKPAQGFFPDSISTLIRA